MSRSRSRLAPGVVAAVRRELARLERRRAGVRGSVEAELALKLAAEVDAQDAAADPSPLRDRVAAGRALADVMAALRESAPEEKPADRLDELAKRREARRAS